MEPPYGFAYTWDDRLKLAPRLETFTPEDQAILFASLIYLGQG